MLVQVNKIQALDASSQQAMFEADTKILADRAYTVFQNCLDNPNGSQPHQPTQQDWDAQDFPNFDSVVRAIEKLLADRQIFESIEGFQMPVERTASSPSQCVYKLNYSDSTSVTRALELDEKCTHGIM